MRSIEVLTGCSFCDPGLLIDLEDLPEELHRRPALVAASTVIRPLREVEREYILAALQRNGGNKTQTAKQLHIAAVTLFRKLKEYTTDVAAWRLTFRNQPHSHSLTLRASASA